MWKVLSTESSEVLALPSHFLLNRLKKRHLAELILATTCSFCFVLAFQEVKIRLAKEMKIRLVK